MKSDKTLDAKGLACPMPIVKTKKAMDEMESGQVLEIHATDKGAKNDLTSWTKSGG
ncbi:MAG TPA: sulfurtransferase TusA family protein, partial [Bacillales bacterium]|nr:sulfurtransferase TusA family protein [Bacillales bacterium]